MKITSITYSKTVESQVMGAGIWTKISVTGEVGENENVANAIEEAKTEVETALQKYLPQPQMEDTYSSVIPKRKMDIIVLKQYEDAIKRKDEKTITELLKHYDVTA